MIWPFGSEARPPAVEPLPEQTSVPLAPLFWHPARPEHVDRLGHLVAGGELDAAPLVAEAIGEVSGEVGAVALIAHAVAGGELESLDVGARNDVHDTRHRIGAIDRRSAVFQHLDSADDRRRDGVEVGRAVRAGPAVHEPATIHQDERPIDAEAPQVDRGRAPPARGPIGVALTAGIARCGRETLKHRLDIHDAALRDLGRADHGRRAHALDVGPLDAATGDDNLAHRAVVRGLRDRLAAGHQRHAGAREKKPFAEPVHDQPPWIP